MLDGDLHAVPTYGQLFVCVILIDTITARFVTDFDV